MEIALQIRDLEPTDLPALDWTGGPVHLRAIAADLGPAASGEVVQLVVELPNRRLVGFGAVDFRATPEAGTVLMLSVHDLVQSLGIGSALVGALERRVLDSGRRRALISVEHDNPRAAALYRRLGYRECGSRLESWPISDQQTYVTVCAVLEHDLGYRPR